MGAKHPASVINRLGANKNEFILAARFLIKKGYAKNPSDAIRYMDENDIDLNDIIDQIITSKQTKLIVEEPETVDED